MRVLSCLALALVACGAHVAEPPRIEPLPPSPRLVRARRHERAPPPTRAVTPGDGLFTMHLPCVPELGGAQISRYTNGVFVIHTQPRLTLSFRTFPGETDLSRLVQKTAALRMSTRTTMPTIAFGEHAMKESGERPCDAVGPDDGCRVLRFEIVYVVVERDGFILYAESDTRFASSEMLAAAIVAETSFDERPKAREIDAPVSEVFEF
jgi:hypothetical protein